MKFIPNSSLKTDMLKEISCTSIDDLFADIPKKISIEQLAIPDGISQQAVERNMRNIASKNRSAYEYTLFLGGGIKPHYIPAVVKSVLARAEFFTAYTPYQSEASQGFLQAMFEYQSMIANLMEMDIANCSLYDGATALGEAALMCTRITKKTQFLVPTNISWEKRSVLLNYTKGAGISLTDIPYNPKTGTIDLSSLKQLCSHTVAGMYIEHPNGFGIFEEDIQDIIRIAHDQGILVVVGVDPLSLGITKSPGAFDADIVIGEGRSLGNPLDCGGSSLGIFCCKKQYLRQIPGRIIGATTDASGKQAFCMTLQTREQHIRRGKATSNICTNEGLCALAAATYLAWLGGNSLQNLSRINFQRGQQLKQVLTEIDGFTEVFSGTSFNECVIQSKKDAQLINKNLLKYHIHGGLILDTLYPNMKNTFLFGVTELHSEEDINRLGDLLRRIA